MMNTRSSKKCLLALALTALMLGGAMLPFMAVADTEPNGTIETAETITVPANLNGHINATDKDDLYKFKVPRGAHLDVMAQPDQALGINLYLYQDQGETSMKAIEVASHRADTVGISFGVPRVLNYTCNSTKAEYWMFAWVGLYKGEGTYQLTIEVVYQDDAGTATDAGDIFTNATVITPGDYKGFVANADDKDIYRVDLVKGDSIYVTVQPEKGLSVNLYLFREVNNDGIISYEELVKDKRTTDEGRGQARHVAYTLNSKSPTTTMFVRVYRDQAMGNYSMNLKVDHQNDGNCGTDAGDDAGTACLIMGTSNFAGFLKPTDVVDYYRFNLSDRQVLYVNITPQNSLSVALTLTVGGTQVGQDKAKHPELELGAVRKVNYTMPRTHDWRSAILKVEMDSGNGNYSITTTVVPKPADKTPPVVTLTDPAIPAKGPRTVKKLRTYDFKGTATDFNEVTSIKFSFDRITWFNASSSGDLGNYIWNCSARFPKKGNNTVYIQATDDQGNTGETGFYVTYKDEKKPSPGFEAVALLAVLAVAAVVIARKR